LSEFSGMDNLKTAIKNLSDLIEQSLYDTLNHADFDDLTQKQLQYLRVIYRLRNPTITELSKELRLTKPTVTVLADKLVAKGYVKRVPSDKDRRSLHLHLNTKGARLKRLQDTVHTRLTEKISDGLDESETAILASLLGKIVKNS